MASPGPRHAVVPDLVAAALVRSQRQGPHVVNPANRPVDNTNAIRDFTANQAEAGLGVMTAPVRCGPEICQRAKKSVVAHKRGRVGKEAILDRDWDLTAENPGANPRVLIGSLVFARIPMGRSN